jgi:hypothetical protein
MRVATPFGRTTTRAVVLLTAATFAACNVDQGSTGPRLPGNPGPNPQIRSAAFIADVNVRTREIRITAPVAGVATGAPAAQGAASGPSLHIERNGGPVASILAGDVVELTTSGFTASAVGQFTPGKVRVTFDVNITNRLASVELITPTFPQPPAGVSGVLLFPFENVVIVTSGGTSTGGDGTEVLVELPSRGQVEPSTEWDGAPHNFFNDGGCATTDNDCYRYQTFATPLVAGGTSEAQQVGFDLDPTVGRFRARLIVAADLRNSGAAPTGTVAGAVTSPQRGALSGVTVTVQSGGFTGTTNGGGAYTITNVTTGPKTVSLTGLPSGCTDPGSQGTTVTSGNTSTVNFTVQCSVPSGTINGTISSSQGGGLNNVSVSATPTGGSQTGSVNTNTSGFYSLTGVPVGAAGTGDLTLGNLPSNCTNPGPIPYSGLTDGGTITQDVTVACTPPPQGYQYTATWGAITNNTVTLTISIDMGTFNDPAVNGTSPDDIASAQGELVFLNSRLQFVSAAAVSGSPNNQVVATENPAGTIQWGSFSTLPGLKTGVVPLAVFTFNVLSGGPSSRTTASSFLLMESNAGNNLIPNVIVNEGTINIP